MKRINLLGLILILTLTYLTGCSEGSNSSSESSFSKNELESESLNDLPQQEENIVDDVNFDYINWFRDHMETTLRTSTKEVANSIDNYSSSDLLNTMNKIEELIDQANSKDFSDPTGELKNIHSKYLDALSVLEEATTISESVFSESGKIDEEQRKLLVKAILNWQGELRPVMLSMDPYLGILLFSDEIIKSPNPSNYAKRAEYYEATSLYKQALADYQKASNLLPESDYLKRKVEEMKLVK